MGRLKPLALLLPLLLWGCLFQPGKFVSTLTINADRSFAFSYVGEVIAAEDSPMTSDAGKNEAEAKSEQDAELRAVAEALRKEPGILRADYLGNRVFMIDYRANGSLTHAFAFPYNIDAKMVLPFLAVELRGRDRVRVLAPGFANDDKEGATAMTAPNGKASSRLDGVFILTTDAEIVSQNTEDGPKTGASAKTITWNVNPLTKDAPMAVLRVAGLP